MLYVGVSVVGYLVGSFPTGVVLTRRKYGLDVREMGSGNIGATNVTRVFGWYAGVIVFLVDFLKAYIPLELLRRWRPEDPWLITYAGAALVFGHCFSLYLKFRGGKGVATSLGCLAIVVPWAALCSAISYAVLLGITRISAVGSLGGLLVTWIYVAIAQPSPPVWYLVAAISVVVLIRHRDNIRRLRQTIKARAT